MKKIFEWFMSLFSSAKDVPTIPKEETPVVLIKTEATQVTGPFSKLRPNCHGIDISHHNEKVDFDKLKQSFIFMKATEGAKFVSPVFKVRMKEAAKRNIPCGAYHYFKPGVDPLVQAKHFCNILSTEGMGDLPAVCDIEEMNGQSKAQLIEDLEIFLRYVKYYTNAMPMIYSGYSFLVELNLPESFSQYPLWLAWYADREKLKAPAPWKEWTFWQYSESEIVDGVGKCDVNLFKQ
jgi:lysozyme